jgi:hypothetical protein
MGIGMVQNLIAIIYMEKCPRMLGEYKNRRFFKNPEF